MKMMPRFIHDGVGAGSKVAGKVVGDDCAGENNRQATNRWVIRFPENGRHTWLCSIMPPHSARERCQTKLDSKNLFDQPAQSAGWLVPFPSAVAVLVVIS